MTIPWWTCSVLLLGAEAVRPAQDLVSQDAFQQLYRRYFAHYKKGAVRSIPGLSAHEIPIQYEFEVPNNMYRLKMTPELLLMRGGINNPHFASAIGHVFQSDSPWWHIEMDGLGSKHHQVLEGLPEANSVVVRPQTVLNSTLPHDLVKYLEKLQVPPSRHKSSFQFTLGVPMTQVSALLKRMPSMQQRHHATTSFCRNRSPSCSEEYEGILLLCQMVLERASKCSACGFPKRCQSPWLLRTHIGDLVKTLPEVEREKLEEEVLELFSKGGDVQLYPKGIMDYLHFPEMAEMSGMVQHRWKGTGETPMPTQMADLLKLAERMLHRREEVDAKLRGRPCRVNSAVDGRSYQAPSAREWLQGAQRGQDLMSDHDSPAAKASLSSTLWRSMGQWRWSPNEPRIFLECRNPQSCLGIPSHTWHNLSYEEMLMAAARAAHEFETP